MSAEHRHELNDCQYNDGVTSLSSSQLVSCALDLLFLSLKHINRLWNILI